MIETLDLCDNHLLDDSGIAIATMLENNVNITKVVSIANSLDITLSLYSQYDRRANSYRTNTTHTI